MFGLHAPFWLCILVNLKENQTSILHGMVIVAREPDLVLSRERELWQEPHDKSVHQALEILQTLKTCTQRN